MLAKLNNLEKFLDARLGPVLFFAVNMLTFGTLTGSPDKSAPLVNPATGLPMVGGTDIEGNAYGYSDTHSADRSSLYEDSIPYSVTDTLHMHSDE